MLWVAARRPAGDRLNRPDIVLALSRNWPRPAPRRTLLWRAVGRGGRRSAARLLCRGLARAAGPGDRLLVRARAGRRCQDPPSDRRRNAGGLLPPARRGSRGVAGELPVHPRAAPVAAQAA